MKTVHIVGTILLLGPAPLPAQITAPDQSEVVAGPTYTPFRDLAISRGAIVEFTMDSKDSNLPRRRPHRK